MYGNISPSELKIISCSNLFVLAQTAHNILHSKYQSISFIHTDLYRQLLSRHRQEKVLRDTVSLFVLIIPTAVTV